MQLDRIVIGVDFSEPCIRAVEWVARVLAPGAMIVLTHVIEQPTARGAPNAAGGTDDSHEDRERVNTLAQLGELALDAGVPLTRLEVAYGVPAAELVAVAERYDADLIVLGAHRSRAGLRTWLGGTAEQLLRMARVPVLVAAQVADGSPRRVLAAAADPRLASSVRDWADGLAARFSASEVVMGVSPEMPWSSVVTFDSETRILEEAEQCRNGIIVLGCGAADHEQGLPSDGATTAVLRRATCPVIAMAALLRARPTRPHTA